MASAAKNQYTPDVVSPPGATLLDALDERGMTQVDLAERTGRPTKTINEIIKGKAAITPATALQFEHVLGIPASFWNSRESIYRDFLARRAEHERLLSATPWMSMFPVAVMAKRGWIQKHNDEADQARELLAYLQVASPDIWRRRWEASRASFRLAKTFSSKDGVLAAWLRQGEIQAESIECAPYDKRAFKNTLVGVRGLTRKPMLDVWRELVDVCASTGVAVVVVPQLPGSAVSGATKWMGPTKALIQLSLRYKRDDQFWFSFFHEAGHICLHGRRDVFIEDDGSESDFEDAADRFAANHLIPPTDYRRFAKVGVFDEVSIREFSKEVGISPGVVVGRLQHDEHLAFGTKLNGLKRRLAWADTPC